MILKKLMLCALTLALAGPGAGLAAPVATFDAGHATLTVRHGDLDLATRRGARLMILRLDEAAKEVCGSSSFVSLAYKEAVRSTKCYRESMNRALAGLDSPNVSALYRAPAVAVAAN
jgi:UrcA family protein